MEPAYLVIPTADGERQVQLGQGNMWRIGRNEQNAVVIPDELVSRNHAIVQRTETGQYYLIDMGSLNGSFVNGSRVCIPVVLKDGDQISLGEFQIAFRHPAGAASATGAEGGQESPEQAATKGFFAPRMTTVLVVDVRDFTKLTQQIDQALLCQVMGTWFREGGQIMQQQGSWAQKYIGDALMSVWVHKSKGQEQETLEIIRALSNFAKVTATLQSRFELEAPIRIGAGINSGLATVGNTGTGELTDYTALGDTVNAAFRIETATKELGMEVALGTATFECLRKCSKADDYFVERMVHLKGYERPTKVWAASLANVQKFVLDSCGLEPRGAPILRT